MSIGSRRFSAGLLVSICSCLLVLPIWFGGLLERWEHKAVDSVAQLTASPSASSDEIILVLLDQNSLDWVHKNLSLTWPWPRELHGAVVSALNRRGAKSIGVDVLFTEPSVFGVGDDTSIGEAISQSEAIALGSVAAGSQSGSFVSWPGFVEQNNASFKNEGMELFPQCERAVMPIEELGKSGAVLCNVTQQPDDDGVNRRMYPVTFFDQTPLFSLGLGMFLARHDDAEIRLDGQTLLVGNHHIPLDQIGRAIPRFRGTSGKTYTTLSAASLIREQVLFNQGEKALDQGLEQVKEKYVIYGFSAPGLLDLRPTPLGSRAPGVELHATFLDNLLENTFLREVPRHLQLLIFLPLLLVSTVFLTGRALSWATSSVILLCVVFPPIGGVVLYQSGFLIEPVAFSMLLVAGTFFSVLLNFYTEGKQRRFIKHSFRHYLSPDVVDQLIKDPGKLQLGGERKEITIFFSDLQGFTSISEGMDPEALTALLNRYLTAMTDIILDEGGTVDKYEGDAIIAFWNAPLSLPDHALRAVRAAVRCQEELTRLRPEFKEECGHDLHMRIGLNTGVAVVGNFGSSRRFDYTMLGDAVNLAARLEGVNKLFGTFTLISAHTWELLEDRIHGRVVGDVAVIGREEPVRVYEVCSEDYYHHHKDSFELFEQARKLFCEDDFSAAERILQQVTTDDPVTRNYLNICERVRVDLRLAGVKNGVWMQEVK